jgi:hypothetical protein
MKKLALFVMIFLLAFGCEVERYPYGTIHYDYLYPYRYYYPPGYYRTPYPVYHYHREYAPWGPRPIPHGGHRH